MQIDLHGKRVLVTAGNSGPGAEMVKAFGAAGAKVGVNYTAGMGVTLASDVAGYVMATTVLSTAA